MASGRSGRTPLRGQVGLGAPGRRQPAAIHFRSSPRFSRAHACALRRTYETNPKADASLKWTICTRDRTARSSSKACSSRSTPQQRVHPRLREARLRPLSMRTAGEEAGSMTARAGHWARDFIAWTSSVSWRWAERDEQRGSSEVPVDTLAHRMRKRVVAQFSPPPSDPRLRRRWRMFRACGARLRGFAGARLLMLALASGSNWYRRRHAAYSREGTAWPPRNGRLPPIRNHQDVAGSD